MKKPLLYFILLTVLNLHCDAGTGTAPATQLELSLTPSEGQCATHESSEATLTRQDTTITFDGIILTSNPCYTLQGSAEQSNSSILMQLTPVSSLGEGEYCVQCVGEISFSASIEPLEPGTYQINVRTTEFSTEKTLISETVTLP